jgi:hypothetical protein
VIISNHVCLFISLIIVLFRLLIESCNIPTGSTSYNCTNPLKNNQLSSLHLRYKKINSHNLHEHFTKNSGKEFYRYHKVSEKNWSTFKEKNRPLSIVSNIVLDALNSS